MNNDTTRNPDILNCLANLSSDEVFTPPELANKMLDLLPQELFKTKHTTFLDPCCKSGVFLREIAKRLIKGLENEIPDLQERVNWIMTKQLFGIPLTDLTAKMTRRTLYCSRHPTGKYSVVNTFDETTKFGNIYSKVASHEYDKSGKCIKCGASREVFKNSKEQHAYYFIHANKPKEIFKMKFDVIIGNPPYQLSTGGGQAQATPIYNKFIEQAKKLNPRYLVMITPSRYFAGGIGLDDFRKSMLSDKRISHIVDYLQSEECFPGVVIAGGVNYFLWEKEYNGPCKYTAIDQGKYSTAIRDLDEYEVFVRSNIRLSKIKKIEKLKEKSISTIMSPLSPFGINSFVRGNEEENLNDYSSYITNSSDEFRDLVKELNDEVRKE